MKRLLCLAVSLAVGVAGCSAVQRNVTWCAFHTYRLVHDVRAHHLGYAAFQAILSAHHCARVRP